MKIKQKIFAKISLTTKRESQKKKFSPKEAFERLRGSVISYKDPFKPIGLEDWEALKR